MNSDENIAMLKKVAHSLKPLLESEETVFIGGAVVSLLITDKATSIPRATMDVDIVIRVKTRLKYAQLEQKIREMGFKPIIGEVICRWNINDVIVDIMPLDKEILGFSNRWYPVSLKEAIKFELDENLIINLVSPACFLATKIEAFQDRGRGDFIGSHDIEDIINVIDGCQELSTDIENSPQSLKRFLVQRFRAYLKKERFHESIKTGLLPDMISQERYYIIKNRIEKISKIKYF